MIFKHTCLDGEERLGQELDCAKCRVLLLQAFRDPAAPPLPSGTPVPHLVLPDTGRTVEINPVHTGGYRVDPHADRPGGAWTAYCSCGWQEDGQYARDGMGALAAERLAKIKMNRHLENPLKGTEDQ